MSGKRRRTNEQQDLSHSSQARASQQTAMKPSAYAGPSLPMRIGSSASSLARDVFCSRPDAVTSDLAASWANAGKAGPSSSGALRPDGPSTSVQESRGTYSTAQSRQGSQFTDSFRSDADVRGQSDGETYWPEDEGFISHTKPYRIPRVEGEDLTYQHQWKARFEDLRPSARAVGQANVYLGDGSEVVALLNEPSSEITAASLQHDIQTSERDAADTVADLFGEEHLTQEERRMTAQLRSAVDAAAPPTLQNRVVYEQDGNINSPAPERPYSTQKMINGSRPSSPQSNRQLQPNVELLHLPHSSSPTAVRRLSLSSDSSINFFSSHKEREEWYAQWMTEWDDVLNNYHESVWGVDEVLRADLEAARMEMQEVKEKDAKGEKWWEDDAAVRRLRMVLGHLGVNDGMNKGGMKADPGGQEVERADMQETWRRIRGKGKQRADERAADGEPIFRCPDCDGIYGSDTHLLQHQGWQERTSSTEWHEGAIERELRRQVEALSTIRKADTSGLITREPTDGVDGVKVS